MDGKKRPCVPAATSVKIPQRSLCIHEPFETMQAQHLCARIESRTLPPALRSETPRPCPPSSLNPIGWTWWCGAGRQRAGQGEHSTSTHQRAWRQGHWAGGLRRHQALGDAGQVRAGDAGVVIDEAYGYAVEAMRLVMDWAFTPVADGGLQLRLVAVTTTATNTPLLALAEDKSGLTGKGVLRDHEFGDPAGEMYYELTAAEWNHIKKKNML